MEIKNLQKHTLILLRHSKAELNSDINDFDRELTPGGRKKAIIFANKLVDLNIYPDQIITSKASRAMQTTQCIMDVLQKHNDKDIPVKQSKSLYFADEEKLFSKIKEHANGKIVMVVGHMPTIGKTAIKLSKVKSILEAQDYNLSTAQAFVISGKENFKHWQWGEQQKICKISGTEKN